MKRQVADRLFLNAISFSVIAVAYFEPRSVAAGMVQAGGFPAHLSMAVLFVFTIIALADTIVNDMMSKHRIFRLGLEKRRGLWVIIAIIYAIIAFVAIRTGYGWSSMVYWLLVSARSMGVSFLDLYYEFEPVVNDPTTPINATIPGVIGDI